MKQPKFIVICGPTLFDHDSQILDLIHTAHKELSTDGKYVRHEILPEKTCGAQAVRNMVYEVISTNQKAIFVTRYEHAVSEFACAVADGTISRDDFIVRLLRYDEFNMHKLYISEHKMSDDGQTLGDGWPMGILW